MNVSCSGSSTKVRDEEVREFVDRSLTQFVCERGQIAHFQRIESEYQSSCAVEDLDVSFADGFRMELVFKNLSPTGLLEDAQRVRPLFLYDPRREIHVYRDVLWKLEPMPAAYLGSLIDTEQHRYWLLIEKVAGEELYKVGDLSIWCQVARWLAGMHGLLEFVPERQELRSVLSQYDAEFYDIWITRAEQFSLKSNATQNFDHERIRWLADRYRRIIPVLCGLPSMLIHGEFYASNVLIEETWPKIRICPIDWETAALGPALMDLAALVSGDWTDAEREMLTRSYFDALVEPEAVLGRHEFDHALRCCRLHLAVRWLGWAENWNPPADHRRDWLAEAVQLAEGIDQCVPSLT